MKSNVVLYEQFFFCNEFLVLFGYSYPIIDKELCLPRKLYEYS